MRWRHKAVGSSLGRKPLVRMMGLLASGAIIGAGPSYAQSGNACSAFLRTNADVLRTVDDYAQGIARKPNLTAADVVSYVSSQITQNVRSASNGFYFSQHASLYYGCLDKVDRSTIANSWPKLNAVLVEKEKREAVQAEAQRQSDLARQQKEREAEAADAERARQQAAINAQPARRLQRAYRLYIAAKECFEAREGYELVYLNERQMADAKARVVAIEKALKESDPSIDPDTIWTQATQPEDTEPTNNIAAIFMMADMIGKKWVSSPEWVDESEGYCHRSYNSLSDLYVEIVPSAKDIKKDF